MPTFNLSMNLKLGPPEGHDNLNSHYFRQYRNQLLFSVKSTVGHVAKVTVRQSNDPEVVRQPLTDGTENSIVTALQYGPYIFKPYSGRKHGRGAQSNLQIST